MFAKSVQTNCPESDSCSLAPQHKSASLPMNVGLIMWRKKFIFVSDANLSNAYDSEHCPSSSASVQTRRVSGYIRLKASNSAFVGFKHIEVSS